MFLAHFASANVMSSYLKMIEIYDLNPSSIFEL